MSFMSLNGQGLSSYITLTDVDSNFPMQPGQILEVNSISYDGGPIKISNLKDIKVTNGHVLTIPDSTLPLANLTVVQSKVTWKNSYTGPEKTTITLGQNSTVTQTGIDLPIDTITLDSGSSFNFTYKGDNYTISYPASSPGNAVAVVVNDLHTVVEISKALNKKFSNSENPKVEIKDIDFLKAYQENKSSVKLFMEQNEDKFIECYNKVDTYINNNYFELTRVSHDLQEVLPLEILNNISSFLELKDVTLTGTVPDSF